MVNAHHFQLYDHLLQFQLFQGLSRTELLQLAGNTKFGFMKQPAARLVAKADEACTQLLFLVSGRLSLLSQSADGGYTVEEQLSAPWLLQPEALFGASPRYTHTVRTLQESHFITLSKEEVLRLADDFLTVRLNLLNLLTTLAQRRALMPWRRTPQSLRERVVRFIVDHCVYPAGHKELRILMRRLADELGCKRLDVSKTLNELQADALIQLHRGRIEIPLLEHLLSTSTNPIHPKTTADK